MLGQKQPLHNNASDPLRPEHFKRADVCKRLSQVGLSKNNSQNAIIGTFKDIEVSCCFKKILDAVDRDNATLLKEKKGEALEGNSDQPVKKIRKKKAKRMRWTQSKAEGNMRRRSYNVVTGCMRGKMESWKSCLLLMKI